MAEPIKFTYKELAEAMGKSKNIHEGIWGIFVEFGIGATNISQSGKGEDIIPAAIVPAISIGLQRFEKSNNLAVDASEVNPDKQKAG